MVRLPTILLLFTSFTSARPGLTHFVETLEKREPQAGNEPTPTTPFAVTGVMTNSIQPRLEIRELASQTDQFNIFILALHALQQQSESYFLSYLGLGTIHGAPQVSWDGVQGVPNPNQVFPGYCAHQSNVFLPWHRPYLALYEQMLINAAEEVAATWPAGPDRDTYAAAASSLRIPYWDWAMDIAAGDHSLPEFAAEPTIDVTTPNGTQTIHNPLYSYVYQTATGQAGLTWSPWDQWSETLRWPTASSPSASTDSQALILNLDNIQPNNKQRLYNLFNNQNFTQVGTNPYLSQGPGSYDSFEALHDQIHVFVGGSNDGNMAIIAVSSYDPAFWLHHTMIDRVFAMWQALYPESYVEPARQWVPSFWYDNGTVLDANSGLKPFFSDPNGDFWTSESSRDVTTFGYTYSELQSGNQADVKEAINFLYGSTSSGSKVKRDNQAARTYRLIYQTPNGRLPKSYTIFFFLNNPASEDPTTWSLDTNLLGSQGVLQGMGTGHPIIVTGSAALDNVLEKYVSSGLMPSMQLGDVLNLVAGKMTWRVAMTGTEIPISSIPELKIGLSSRRYVPPQSVTEFPTYLDADWVMHYSATAGQAGGMSNPADV